MKFRPKAFTLIEVPPPELEVIDPTDKFRPAPGGVSVGIPSVTAGTLGGWVWDKTDDTIVMLTNDHIIGDSAGVNLRGVLVSEQNTTK